MSWEKIEGWFDWEDVYTEWAHNAKPDAVFVEVGVFLGRSLAFLLEQLRLVGNHTATVYAIDPWINDSYLKDRASWGGEFTEVSRTRGGPFEAFCATMRTHASGDFDRVQVIRASSVQASRLFDIETIDYTWIDANHTYEFVREDIVVWLPKMKPGGIIGGHDHTATYPGVIRACQERFGNNYEIRSSSWIHRCPSKIKEYKMVTIDTQFPIAKLSPDHTHPHGTKRDNSRNHHFNAKLYSLFDTPMRIMDLGCAGGGFVKDCLDDGHFAIGLEGSDYSKNLGRAEWSTIPGSLFTCDISKPFSVKMNDIGIRFDVVTAWEVMEHLKEGELEVLSSNVRNHLLEQGLWIISVATCPDFQNGIHLHQTVKPREWWDRWFRTFGWCIDHRLTSFFKRDWVRVNENGFNVVLRDLRSSSSSGLE